MFKAACISAGANIAKKKLDIFFFDCPISHN